MPVQPYNHVRLDSFLGAAAGAVLANPSCFVRAMVFSSYVYFRHRVSICLRISG